jgi:hypothetical protein
MWATTSAMRHPAAALGAVHSSSARLPVKMNSSTSLSPGDRSSVFVRHVGALPAESERVDLRPGWSRNR